jgi:uncharacterized protein YcfL
MHMKTNWMLGLVALVAALAAGCASPNTSGFTVGAEPDADGVMQQVLQTDNAKLAKNLAVSDVKTGQTKNGLMKVNLKLTSRHNKTIVAQSKLAWFDADGVEVEPNADAWRPLALNGKETRTIQGVAPTASAVAFKLRVREGEQTRWIIK